MLKELKNVLYVIVIFLFILFTTKYYFSDEYKKKANRSITDLNHKINIYKKNLPLLKNDTNNIAEYVEDAGTSNKKKYSFWKLLIDNEK